MQQDSLEMILKAPWEAKLLLGTDTSLVLSNEYILREGKDPDSTESSHAGKPATFFVGKERTHDSLNWISLVLLGILTIYTMVQFLNYHRIGQLITSFVSRSQARQLIKEGNLFNRGFAVPLQLLAMASISLFIFYLLKIFSLNSFLADGFIGYAEIFLALILLWLIKVMAIYMSGFLLKTENSSREYSINMLIYFIITGLMLTPVLILGVFVNTNIILYGGGILFLLLFFLWIIRALSVGLHESNFSILHLFLYLCTFEFLPLIVLSKIILEAN